MRSIVKRGEPVELGQWKRDGRAAPQNLRYAYLSTAVKDKIKEALLNEQGFLCAYTLVRLKNLEDCHIEHVEPQNAAPRKDIDYGNMAACFPCDGGDVSHGYGAAIKAGTPVVLNVDFVTPHAQGCEQRFLFDDKGEVDAIDGDAAAHQTIETVKLNHKTLIEFRRSAIEANGLAVSRRTTRTARKLKSAAEARRFAQEVMRPDGKGQLSPFCVALAQVALAFAEKEDARSQRMRGQRQV